MKNDIFFISGFSLFYSAKQHERDGEILCSMYSNWSHERYRELCSLFPIEEKNENFQYVQRNAKTGRFNLCTVYPAKKVLLMDEIFDGLDPVMRQLLKKIIGTRSV